MPEALSLTWSALLYLLAFLLIGAGYVGCIIPYPGMLCVLGGCVALDCAGSGPAAPWWVWAVLVLLAGGGMAADNIATMMGAKSFGSSKAACWAALGGAVIGAFFFPVGIIIGPFAAALTAEILLHRKSTKAAAKSGFGALLGYCAGMAIKLLIASAMLLFYWLAS